MTTCREADEIESLDSEMLGLNTYLRSQSVLLRSLSIDFAWALYSIIHFKLSESEKFSLSSPTQLH